MQGRIFDRQNFYFFYIDLLSIHTRIGLTAAGVQNDLFIFCLLRATIYYALYFSCSSQILT